jgi:hypothetical protein
LKYFLDNVFKIHYLKSGVINNIHSVGFLCKKMENQTIVITIQVPIQVPIQKQNQVSVKKSCSKVNKHSHDRMREFLCNQASEILKEKEGNRYQNDCLFDSPDELINIILKEIMQPHYGMGWRHNEHAQFYEKEVRKHVLNKKEIGKLHSEVIREDTKAAKIKEQLKKKEDKDIQKALRLDALEQERLKKKEEKDFQKALKLDARQQEQLKKKEEKELQKRLRLEIQEQERLKKKEEKESIKQSREKALRRVKIEKVNRKFQIKQKSLNRIYATGCAMNKEEGFSISGFTKKYIQMHGLVNPYTSEMLEPDTTYDLDAAIRGLIYECSPSSNQHWFRYGVQQKALDVGPWFFVNKQLALINNYFGWNKVTHEQLSAQRQIRGKWKMFDHSVIWSDEEFGPLPTEEQLIAAQRGRKVGVRS